jgi:integrase
VKTRALQRTKYPGIFQRGDRYVVVFRDPGGRQRKRAAKTIAEARALQATLRADVSRGEYRPVSRETFASYASRWINTYAGRTSRGIRDATRDDYRKRLEQDAIPFFGRMRLTEIQPTDLKAFVAKMAERGISKNTVRLGVAPVRALLATAVEEGLLRSNPAIGLRLFVEPASTSGELHPEEAIKALTEEELTRFLGVLEADDRWRVWRLFFEFLAQSGLRVGEAIELRWKDVDLGERTLEVRRRFYRDRIDRPKSRYGRRRIRLSEATTRALWRIRTEARAGDEELVFTTERGGRIVPSNLMSRVLKPAAVKAGLGQMIGRPPRAESWVGFHTFRHSCATMLFRHGWNAVQVQRWLGHHKPSFTLDTYVHLLEEDLPDPTFFDELRPDLETGVTVDDAAVSGAVA